jgi:hypothetical protein
MEVVKELFDVLEAGGGAGAVLRLCLADLGHEELAPEEAELLLVALIAVGADDVRGPAGALEHDRRLVAGLDLVDDVGDALSELGDRYRLHDGRRYIRVYRCQAELQLE